MNPWVNGSGRMYRRLARAFPHDFRMICGDGLERLGEDIAPLIWRELGVVGLLRLFGDLALHLPLQYLSTWIGTLKEVTMTGDLFEGTWKRKTTNHNGTPATRPSRRVCGLKPRRPGTSWSPLGSRMARPSQNVPRRSSRTGGVVR